MTSTTSRATMSCLEKWIFAFGIPRTIVSDNGPQLISSEFRTFLHKWDIEHVTSSPHYPQSNGEAERAVQTVKNLLNKNDNLQQALCNYRDTPLANGYSPAQLLFGRALNSTGFTVKRSVDHANVQVWEKSTDRYQTEHFNRSHRARERSPVLSSGQQVKVTTGDNHKSGVVRKCEGREVTVDIGTSIIRRNRSQVVTRAPDSEPSVEDEAVMPTPTPAEAVPSSPSPPRTNPPSPVGARPQPVQTTIQPPYKTRSGRIVKPPDKLDL